MAYCDIWTSLLWCGRRNVSLVDQMVAAPTRVHCRAAGGEAGYQAFVLHAQAKQLPLQEQVLGRSDSIPVEQLSVWYLIPPTDAKDALQTTDVECLDGLDVTSVGGLRLTTVQQDWYTYCLVDGNLCKNGKVAIEKEGTDKSHNYLILTAVRTEQLPVHITCYCNADSFSLQNDCNVV